MILCTSSQLRPKHAAHTILSHVESQIEHGSVWNMLMFLWYVAYKMESGRA